MISQAKYKTPSCHFHRGLVLRPLQVQFLLSSPHQALCSLYLQLSGGPYVVDDGRVFRILTYIGTKKQEQTHTHRRVNVAKWSTFHLALPDFMLRTTRPLDSRVCIRQTTTEPIWKPSTTSRGGAAGLDGLKAYCIYLYFRGPSGNPGGNTFSTSLTELTGGILGIYAQLSSYILRFSIWLVKLSVFKNSECLKMYFDG